MSILLADIDATCAALGYHDGEKYHAEPDAIQGLKHLIWILRRDISENYEYRRHLGRAKVLQTDLVPMLTQYMENDDFADVLIRLLVILTNPTLLLYREGPPKDGQGRKIFLELIDILQGYKEAFSVEQTWDALCTKLHKALDIDWGIRSEEQGILIERVLVLIRNVLQVPSNPDAECRADNDASLHDQVIWALQQSGMLDLVLYILSSADENQYHLHALEIVCLVFREQTPESLADASLQRSAAEKHHDEQELIAVRRRERQKLVARPPPGRHSRFGGTYVIQNVKSISDNDIICHQSLERAVALDLDREKSKQKKSHLIAKEEIVSERRSAFSVRLCLREYCIEVLRSAYNTLVRQVRRVLERNIGSIGHDDSYLLWAIRFFMEFNRLSGLQLDLVSESLSVQCFHWVLTRIQHDLDMMTSDKQQARLWAKRLHVGIQTFRELLLSLLALQKLRDDKAQALYDMLLNNVCYVLEYRETILHLLMNYNDRYGTKSYLRDVVETAHIFIKMMEKFCQGTVVVQDKKRAQRRKGSKRKSKKEKSNQKSNEETEEDLQDRWAILAGEISVVLTNDIKMPEDEHPIPFDAASEKSIEDQKGDCMLRIYKFLREEKIEHATLLLRSAREVWPENDCFGSIIAAPEDEMMLFREIFFSKLGPVERNNEDESQNESEEDDDDEDEDDEEGESRFTEKDFRFEDFAKRLVNPKVVRACTIVLSDWEKITQRALKCAVTILHRIAFICKCPAMLFQAVLFNIFQQVLAAPKDPHHEELRRLAVYVVRKFVEIAPTNPKIYAELLFYKSIREANDLEIGYNENNPTSTKGAWSEEQENELRMLFEENQTNPQTDQDVIDWILDNLIDKTRTRRAVLKKLKELSLIFKAPTKKSTAAASNKNLWHLEEDEKLRTLYEEHRMNEDCLERIMEAFGESRNKNSIIKRMIQIHLIADRSEIVPRKSKKPRQKKKQSASSSDDEEMDEPMFVGDIEMVNNGNSSNVRHKKKQSQKQSLNKTKKSRKSVKTPLHAGTVRSLIDQLDEKFEEAIDWLKESLIDAADDIDADADDPDDGVPLVPLQESQKHAMEDAQFKKILIAIGIQPPIEEIESYWKIPIYLTAADLQMRANVVSGAYVADDGNLNRENYGDNETDIGSGSDEGGDSNNGDNGSNENDGPSSSAVDDNIHGNLFAKRRQAFDELVFNQSDNDDEHRAPPKSSKKQTTRQKKKTRRQLAMSDNENENEKRKQKKIREKFNMNDMLKDTNNDDNDSNKDVNEDDGNSNDVLDINSEDLRLRLAELNDSDSSVASDQETTPASSGQVGMGATSENTSPQPKARSRIIRHRPNIIDSDTSDDEQQQQKQHHQQNDGKKDTERYEHGDLSTTITGDITITGPAGNKKNNTSFKDNAIHLNDEENRMDVDLGRQNRQYVQGKSNDGPFEPNNQSPNTNSTTTDDVAINSAPTTSHHVVVGPKDRQQTTSNTSQTTVRGGNDDDDGRNVGVKLRNNNKRERSHDSNDAESGSDEEVNSTKRKKVVGDGGYRRKRIAVIDDDDDDD